MAASPAQASAFPYAEFFCSSRYSDIDIQLCTTAGAAKRRRLDRAAKTRAQHSAEAGSSYAQLNSDGEAMLLPAHRIVLSASKVLAAELDRWKSDNKNSIGGSGRQCVELVVPSELDSADTLKVQHAFVESLYRGAAAALVDAPPQVVLGVLRMADYYQADSLLESACTLLLETLTSGTCSTLAAATPSAAAAAAIEEDKPDAAATALARGVLDLPDEIRQQAAVAGLFNAAAECIAATLPSDLEAAWQPWQEELRKPLLSEPCAEVVKALLQRACARGLAPNTAYAVAAQWCEVRPRGATASERRTVLQGVPLTRLTAKYFATVFLGSPMAAAVSSSELPVILLLRSPSQQGRIAKYRNRVSSSSKGSIADALPTAWRTPDADGDQAAAHGNGCTIDLDVPVDAVADLVRNALSLQLKSGRVIAQLPDSVPLDKRGAAFVNGLEVRVLLGAKYIDAPQVGRRVRITIYLTLDPPTFKVGDLMPAANVAFDMGYLQQSGRTAFLSKTRNLAVVGAFMRTAVSSQEDADSLGIGLRASPEGAVRALRDAGMVVDEVLKLRVKMKLIA